MTEEREEHELSEAIDFIGSKLGKGDRILITCDGYAAEISESPETDPDWKGDLPSDIDESEIKELENVIPTKTSEESMSDTEWEYHAEFKAGKEFAQKKIGELLDEVETAYKENGVDDPNNPYTKDVDPELREMRYQKERQIQKAQVNAIKFAKSWIASGGHTDLDGNRACLPW